MKTIMTNVGGPDGWKMVSVDDDWEEDEWTEVDPDDVLVDGVPELIEDVITTAVLFTETPIGRVEMPTIGRTQTAPLDEARLNLLIAASKSA